MIKQLHDFIYCPLCATTLVETLIENKSRKVCPTDSCNYIFWNNPIPVVAAIVEHRGKILLAHNVDWPENFYAMITGFLEQKESPEQAIIREIKEELFLNAKIEAFIGHYPFKEMNQVLICYWVKAIGEIKLNEELDSYKLITMENISTYDFGPLYLAQQMIGDWIAMTK